VKFSPKQCKQCPFRPGSAPGWLGGYEAPINVFRSLWHGEPFFCHTAIDYEKPDWLERAMKKGKLCTGGLAFANLTPMPPSGHEAIRIAREKVKLAEGIEVMPPNDFMAYHNPKEDSP
jgi:hypothetical protein